MDSSYSFYSLTKYIYIYIFNFNILIPYFFTIPFICFIIWSIKFLFHIISTKNKYFINPLKNFLKYRLKLKISIKYNIPLFYFLNHQLNLMPTIIQFRFWIYLLILLSITLSHAPNFTYPLFMKYFTLSIFYSFV